MRMHRRGSDKEVGRPIRGLWSSQVGDVAYTRAVTHRMEEMDGCSRNFDSRSGKT